MTRFLEGSPVRRALLHSAAHFKRRRFFKFRITAGYAEPMKPNRKRMSAQLELILKNDVANSRVVMSRGGLVSRQHYLRRVRCRNHVTAAELGPIFRKFDELFAEESARRYQVTLQRAFDEGTLKLTRGRVSQTWAVGHLGISARQFHSNKTFTAVLDHFHERIKGRNYLPRVRQETVEMLDAILRSDCPFSKSGLGVGLQELAKRLGTTVAKLRAPELSRLISLKSDELKNGNGHRNGNVVVAGQLHRFNSLEAWWPASFVTAISEKFRTYASGLATPGEHRRQLVKFLEWLAISDHDACRRTFDLIRKQRFVPALEWESVLTTYHVEIQRKLKNPTYFKTVVSCLKNVLQFMGGVGILPTAPTSTGAGGDKRRSSRRRRSVAEVTRISDMYGKHVEAAARALKEARQRFYTTTSPEAADSGPFLQCLLAEFERHPPNGDDFPRVVLDVIVRRLGLIETRAAAIVQVARERLAAGAELLKLADLPDDFKSQLVQASRVERNQLVRKHFPMRPTDVQFLTARGNILQFAKRHLGGVFPPRAAGSPDVNSIGSFVDERLKELGPRTELQRLLTPGNDAQAAGVALSLVASGINLSVAFRLVASHLRPSESRGMTSFVGHKVRANGKPIYADLPSRGAAIQAMTFLAHANAPIRERANDALKELLFLRIQGDRVLPIEPVWFNEWFKGFINGIPELAGLPLSPSMLRSSVLLRAALETDGRLTTGAAIGQHSPAVSERYQSTAPVRDLRDGLMREFQYHFESVCLINATDIAQVVGYSEGSIQGRREALTPTGLGPFCKDPYGKPGFEGQRCSELDCPKSFNNARAGCPQLEIYLTPMAAARMQIWKDILEESAAEWSRDRHERWIQLWLPWLCMLIVIEQKCSRGPLLAAWDAGVQARKHLESQPGYEAPCPW